MLNHENAPNNSAPNENAPNNPWRTFTAPEFTEGANQPTKDDTKDDTKEYTEKNTMEVPKHKINLAEIDRSTNVGFLVGATLDVYDAVAKAAADNHLSQPIILGSGAMYIHAINSGNYSLSELAKSYDERRSFATTSHDVDIDLGFTSEDEVNRFVAAAGSASRQIQMTTRDGQIGTADIMARPPRLGFDPIPVQVGDKAVLLRNPEAMLFGKIDLLNTKPVDQIKQKWGYDVPMFLSVAKSYHQNEGDFDKYLSKRYLEYQRAGIRSRLQQLPSEQHLSDVISAQDVRRILPRASDEVTEQLFASKIGEINPDAIPASCFVQWSEAYPAAMDKYHQADQLAAEQGK